MKVAIMQPYTFPFIGYFQLMSYADKWVIFDDTQYISKGWINRNRILHPDLEKEWQYFTVPVRKHSREIRIKDVEINTDVNWKDEFIGKLSFYKKTAPHFAETMEFVDHCLGYECSSLVDWLEFSLKTTCSYLDIPFEYSVFSQMDVDTNSVKHAGQWALEIADAMNADEYINPQGGAALFDEDEFLGRNIELRFLKANLTPYAQRRSEFVSGLSIVDVMMWNDKDKILDMLEDYQIVTRSSLTD